MRNEAESDSLALGLTSLPYRRSPDLRARGHTPSDRSTSPVWLPSHAGPRLHVERAIHMADTSQSARESQVDLAYRGSQSSRGTQRLLRMGVLRTHGSSENP